MKIERFTLEGKQVRLEPLDRGHIDGLAAAAAVDPAVYEWTVVPQGRAGMTMYVETAISSREAGKAAPFAIVRPENGEVLGSTRFFDVEQWAWPEGHPRHSQPAPDVCEIGYTWLMRPAMRTATNTETKLLMLTHAFEAWKVVRVCLHTDERNARSRAAIERIGGRFEGILRAHRLAADCIPRNSARYSIVAAEWPAVKARLESMGGKYE